MRIFILYFIGGPMKKSIITSIFIFSISTLIAMEESATQLNWEKLPEEVKLHILSYLPEIGNYKDWIRAMTISKEFHSLLTDQQFLNDFAKRLASQNNSKAINLLTEAAKHKNLALTKALINANPELKKHAIHFFEEAANHGNIALTKALIEASPEFKQYAAYLLLTLPYKAKDLLAILPYQAKVKEDVVTYETLFNTLLQAGIDINGTISDNQYNGLMQSLFKRDIDKAKWFLLNGINLDYKDASGRTITNWINESYNIKLIDDKQKQEWLNLIKQAKAERKKADNQK